MTESSKSMSSMTSATGTEDESQSHGAQSASPALSSAASEAMDDLSAILHSVTMTGRFNTTLAAKPEPGSRGQPVKLVTNMFQLTVREERAFHYDITFKAEKKQRAMMSPAAGDDGDGKWRTTGLFTEDIKVKGIVRSLFQQLKTQDSDMTGVKVFFDGKQNMYSLSTALPQSRKEVTFTASMDGEERVVRIVYFFTGHVLDLSQGSGLSRDAMQALEIGIGYKSSLQMLTRGTRSFEQSVSPLDLKGLNLELRMGFVKSVRATERGLCLNLDRAAAVFQKAGPMTQVFMNVVNVSGTVNASMFRLTPDLKRRLERELTNLRFEFRNPRLTYQRKFRLDKDMITELSVSQQMINYKDAVTQITRRMTVAQFYAEKHGIELQWPHMPCFAVGKKDSGNFLPVELCHLLPFQYYDKKMMERIQGTVTRSTIQPPAERYQQILRSVADLKPLAEQMIDCDIDANPTKVMGRVLCAPDMCFANQPKVPVNPSFKKENDSGHSGNPCDFRSGRLNRCIAVKRWSLIQVQDNVPADRVHKSVHPGLIDFGRKLALKAQSCGWDLSSHFPHFAFNFTTFTALKEYMEKALTCGKQELLLFVMPSDAIYADIKKVGNEIGVVTQCLRLDVDNRVDTSLDKGKITKISGHTFLNNMVMKMNAKCGGVNARLCDESMPPHVRQRDCKVMVIGMDVFHPGDSSPIKHSIAGIVASYTPDLTQYLHAARAQPQHRTSSASNGTFKRQEEITSAVFDVVKDFMLEFKKRNQNTFPAQILVLRDGVSEGQFDRVRIIELDQIYRAMEALAFRAKVVFVTVQKRHHFRMFEARGERGHFTIHNPQPGTVVDTKVLNPERFEFYLNSHHALKGTSKGSHYCVVHNESDWTADEVQQLVYYLCFLCARCYKPISIPSPVKYAHLAAEKASKFLTSAIQNRRTNATVDDIIRTHAHHIDKLIYV